mgnify:CR=1 FL=1
MQQPVNLNAAHFFYGALSLFDAILKSDFSGQRGAINQQGEARKVGLYGLYVLGLWAFLTGSLSKSYRLTICKGFETIAADAAEMYK